MGGSMFARDFKGLMDTALGRRDPDLLVINARLFNVYTREMMDDSWISVCGDRIARVGQGADWAAGPGTRVVDAGGRAVVPGFMDGHTHLASMVSPATFLEGAAMGGTTTIVTETMELYPVGGIGGVIDFLDSLEDQPVRILATAPAMGSVCPHTLGIRDRDLRELLGRDRVLGLGESYWQGVFQNPDRFLPAFDMTLASGKFLEGHSAGAGKEKLAAYLALGVSSCHEPITRDQVLERLRSGIHVMVREGGVRSDLPALAGVADSGLDLQYLCLVSDSMNPEALVREGYMEGIVAKAVQAGFNPMDAVRMVTLNTARHFNLDAHLGGIAPGRFADMVIMPSMDEIRADMVIRSGRVIAEQGEILVKPRRHRFGAEAFSSIRLARPLTAGDFEIPAPAGEEHRMRVIHMVTPLVTAVREMTLTARGGRIVQDPESDLVKVAALDRTGNRDGVFTALLSGFGIREGAMAASNCWDSPDMVVAGADDGDMALAVNRVRELGGGVVAVRRGRVEAELPLPVYGLLSDEPLERVCGSIRKVCRAAEAMGCPFPDPVLSLATMTGAAIPYIRIWDRGLVDLKDGKAVDLLV